MLDTITDELVAAVAGLRFGPPVAFVYNPLEYARPAWDEYCRRFGGARNATLIVGLNPGPFGMAQIGVPFGEIAAVRDWMGIIAPVGRPAVEHPKRPVLGFACERSEVSGKRLWTWAIQRYGAPDNFFASFFVTNYCPLVFMEASGRNLTPDKLTATERAALFAACDTALRRTVGFLGPTSVIALGTATGARVSEALSGTGVTIGVAPHPSPANPAANRGWSALMDRAVAEMGIEVPV